MLLAADAVKAIPTPINLIPQWHFWHFISVRLSPATMIRSWGVATVTFGDFEWDTEKAAANVAKHGVTFEEATTVFLDLEYLLIRDETDPERFVALGMSGQTQILFVVHCERAEKVRIISARRATRRERETYEQRRKSN